MKTESRLEKVLEKGAFAVTSECGPPRGADPDVIREKGKLLKGVVDAANITDCQTSVVRMSSLSSCLILKEMGFDPILQMVTRDRNRIAIQSDILGRPLWGSTICSVSPGITSVLAIIPRPKTSMISIPFSSS